MDERKKIQAKNAVKTAAVIPPIIALAAVAQALAPLHATIRVANGLNKTKKRKGDLTKKDLAEAAKWWSKIVLLSGGAAALDMVNYRIKENKKNLEKYDRPIREKAEAVQRAKEEAERKKYEEEQQRQRDAESKKRHEEWKAAVAAATTPEKLHETGVDSLLKLIEFSPSFFSTGVHLITGTYLAKRDGDLVKNPCTGKELYFNGKPMTMSDFERMYGRRVTFLGDIVILHTNSPYDKMAEFNYNKVLQLQNDNDFANAVLLLKIPALQGDVVAAAVDDRYKKEYQKQKQDKLDNFAALVQQHIETNNR